MCPPASQNIVRTEFENSTCYDCHYKAAMRLYDAQAAQDREQFSEDVLKRLDHGLHPFQRDDTEVTPENIRE